MTYSEFLFSQLFMNHIQNNITRYNEVEYDLIFSEILRHHELFLISDENIDTQSEYDCIVDYLEKNVSLIK
jgi:hypothetical protein